MRVLLGCLTLVVAASLAGCEKKVVAPGPAVEAPPPDRPDGPAPKQPPGVKEGAGVKTVLVIHGGAGVLTEAEMKEAGLRREDYEQALAQALRAGREALKAGRTSVEAAEAAVRVMEDSDLFNAGRGGAFTSDGRVELDAAIMEGNMTGAGQGKADPRKRAGAVAGVSHIKNPISAARAVLEMDGGRHVLLAGDGAEAFAFGDPGRAKKYGIERVSNLYFWTDRRVRQIRDASQRNQPDFQRKRSGAPPAGGADRRLGTVGAVARAGEGRLAAGTSTGGLTNKLPGRVGDSPVIGAGTYADDRACGVSCTGTGEVFIRHAVAHDVVARMLYAGDPVKKAAAAAIDQLPDEEGGVGGLIALDRDGRHHFAMSAKSVGMYRGYVTEDGRVFVGIFRDEEEKLVPEPPREGK